MSENSGKLFEEFAPVSYEQWKEKTISAIKGADFEKRMVWKPIEGFSVQPVYNPEDIDSLKYLDVLPGQFPYTRGAKKETNEWLIRQDIVVASPKQANEKALNILMKGITSLGFKIEDTSSWSASDISTLLEGINTTAVELCFVIKKGKTNFLTLFVEYLKGTSVDLSLVNGSINSDYIGNLTLKGAFCYNDQAKCEEFMADTYNIAKELPNFSTCEVHADYLNNAGSTVTQELAFGLAIGVDYLNASIDKDLDLADFAKRIKFNFAVGGSYFMEIAKFRAAKMLWAKIVEAYKPKCDCNSNCCDTEQSNSCSCCSSEEKICKCACKMQIHAITSSWNKSVYDPYVNMLRTQTEAMSASIGGVDSLTVQPFNAIFEEPTAFSERIARNQQILLKEECYFDKVVDPAAGSYYIENLTDKVAEAAWDIFLAIQDKGGYIAAFKEGYIQGLLAETASKRNSLVSSRRHDILGVNQFPNFSEQISAEINEDLFQPVICSSCKHEQIAEPVKLYRGSQAFELLRYKTDQYSKSNDRPKAFMLTIGNPVMRSARSQFACNFFACAGIGVIDNIGFKTVSEGVDAAKASGAKIVVICSSDEEYAEVAPEIYEALKDKIVVVAGAPACADELKAKGITNFVNVKSNLLETLQGYQKELGI